MENNLTKSQRKFIRSEKSSIRERILDVKKQEELISALYKKFSGQEKTGEAKKEEAKITEVKKPEAPKKVSSKVKVKK